MPIALTVAVLVAVVAVVLVVVRQRALAQTRADLAAATRRAEAAERERGELERAARALGETSEQRGTALEASRAQAAELEASLAEVRATAAERGAALDAAVTELAEVERRLHALRRPRPGQALDERTAAACWQLLLARVERQWAVGVAAGPEERGIAGLASDQIVEAVSRELERLREEVGVHAEVAVSGPPDAQPLVALLVIGEALAILAPHAERVRVELDREVEVVGEDWFGPDGDLDRLGELASATGLLRRLTVAEGRVEVVLGPAPPSVPSA